MQVDETKRVWRADACVTYYRCSGEAQDASIPDQRSRIETEMQRLGLARVVANFEDDGRKGHDETRPGLLALLDFVRKHPNPVSANADFIPILVYDVSRFGRFDDPKSIIAYATQVERYGYEFYSVAERIRSRGNIADWMHLLIRGDQAHGYTVNLAQYALRTASELAKAGWWPGGTPPFGYDRITIGQDGKPKYRYVTMPGKVTEKRSVDGRKLLEVLKPIADKGRLRSVSTDKTKGDHVKLAINRDRAKTVRRIYSLFVNGSGLRRVAITLNDEKVESARGGKWTTGSVRAILVNPNYTPRLVWGKRSDSKFFTFKVTGTNGQTTLQIEPRDVPKRIFVKRDPEECVQIRDCHEPLIDQKTWDKAQALLKQRHPQVVQPTGQGARSSYLLSGIIVCRCGFRWQGDVNRGNRYYICGGHHSGGSDCRRTPIPIDWLHEKIITGIQKRLFDGYLFTSMDEVVRTVNQRLRAERTTTPDAEATQRAQAEFDLKTAELERIRQKLEKADPDVRELCVERVKAMEREVDRIKSQLECAAQKVARPKRKAVKVKAEQVAKRLWNLRELLETGTIEERRQFIRAFVQHIRIDNRNVPLNITAAFYKNPDRGLKAAVNAENGRVPSGMPPTGSTSTDTLELELYQYTPTKPNRWVSISP